MITPQTNRSTENRVRDKSKVRPVICYLWERMWELSWPGKAGLSALSAYKALLRLAWHHGELIPAGVRISVSMRQWAELLGSGSEATQNAQNWLKRERLIRRDGRGHGPTPGAFVLLTGVSSTETLAQGYHLRKGVSRTYFECFDSGRMPLRWSAPGERRLGKTKEALLDALHYLGGSATDRELSLAIGREERVRAMRAHLDELVDEGILRKQGERFVFHKHTGIELVTTRATNGEMEADDRQKDKHKEERGRFLEAWKRGEVVSKSKLERRRQNRPKPEGKTLQKEERRQQRERYDQEDVPVPSPNQPSTQAGLAANPALVVEEVPDLTPSEVASLEAILAYERERGSGAFGWDQGSCKRLFYGGPIRDHWPTLEELERIRRYVVATSDSGVSFSGDRAARVENVGGPE